MPAGRGFRLKTNAVDAEDAAEEGIGHRLSAIGSRLPVFGPFSWHFVAGFAVSWVFFVVVPCGPLRPLR